MASGRLVLASDVFSFLIDLSSRYSLVYGSLTSIIILMVWLYVCGNILLVGAVINYVGRPGGGALPVDGEALSVVTW